MTRKRRKQNNIVIYVASMFAIFIIIVLFYTGVIKIFTSNDNISIKTGNTLMGDKLEKEQQYYTNSIISQTGTIIKIKYNIKGGFSHKIIAGNSNFYVKSNKYNLDDFLNKQISFSGEVIGFFTDNIPVLNIIEIKSANEEQKENSLSKKEKDKYLSTKGIIIDLTGSNFKVSETNNEIYIYKILTGNTYNLSGEIEKSLTGASLTGTEFSGYKIKFVKIIPFKCIKGNNLYDCEEFKNQAKLYRFSITTNNNGVVFYKIPEVNQYVILNDNNYGYNIYPLTGDFFQFINYISIVDLKTEKENLIKNTCKDDKIKLTKILTLQNSGDNYKVSGFDQNANKIICNLSITGDNQLIGQLKSLVYDNNDFSKIGVLDDKKYLVYKSKAYGYALYMPKSVKYSALLINKDFGVSGLKCKQVIKIADWKTGSLKDPNVKVYYCESDLSLDTLKGFLKDYMIKQNNGKTIILEVSKDSLSKKIASDINVY